MDDFLRVLARLGPKVAFLQRPSPPDGIEAEFGLLHLEFLVLEFVPLFLIDRLSVLYVVFSALAGRGLLDSLDKRIVRELI